MRHYLYGSQNVIKVIISRNMRWVVAYGTYGVLVRKPKGKRPLGTPWNRWKIVKWILER